jgi:hypothetical protein
VHPSLQNPMPRRLGVPALLFAATALAAACSDGPAGVVPLPVPGDDSPLLALVDCTAEVRSGAVRCGEPRLPTGVRGRVIGGQNVNIRLTSTNISYDTTTLEFGADVTLTNLRVERIGTPGAPDTTHVRVFFHAPPAATSGTGLVEVENADGVGTFTGTAQPYFQYAGTLGYNQTSAVKRWKWSVPRSVGSFSFTVAVSADVLPVVVFQADSGGNRDIWRMAVDGSDRVRLTTHAASDFDPTVGGGRVVFVSTRDSVNELYSVSLAGGAQTRLTTTTAAEIQPALTLDGTKLAYTSDAAGVNKLWTASSTGAGAARATPGGFGFSGSIESSPSWDAGGTRLAFSATTNSSSDVFDFLSPFAALPTLRVGGTSQEVEPAWSADGRYVAFVTDRDTTNTEVYLQTVSSGTVTRLTYRSGSDGLPAWLSNGQLVFVRFTGTTPSLARLDPASPGTVYPIPVPASLLRPTNPAGVPF